MKTPLKSHLQIWERRGVILFVLSSVLLGMSLSSCKSKATKFYESGQKNFQSGKSKEAIGDFQSALTLEPKNVKILYALGWTHLSVGQIKESLIHFSKCIKYDENYYGGYKGLGGIFTQMGDFEKAEKNYLLALEKSPKNPAIYSNLGELYLKEGKIKQAQSAYQKGKTLLPKYADLDNGFMEIALSQGQFDQVIEQANKALKMPYKQKILKAQTYQLMAQAHIARATVFQESKNIQAKNVEIQKAREAIQNGINIVANPQGFGTLLQEIKTLENTPSP